MIEEKLVRKTTTDEEEKRIKSYNIVKAKSSCDQLQSNSEIESNYVINTIAKSILGKTNYYDIAWEVVVNITSYLNCEDCVIYLIREDGKYMEQLAAFGNKVNMDWKHGIPQIPEERYNNDGRISIIAWGWVKMN